MEVRVDDSVNIRLDSLGDERGAQRRRELFAHANCSLKGSTTTSPADVSITSVRSKFQLNVHTLSRRRDGRAHGAWREPPPNRVGPARRALRVEPDRSAEDRVVNPHLVIELSALT